MATSTRNDVHRPSEIEPLDYVFVSLGYQKSEDIEDAYSIAENFRLLREFRERTGAKYSQHAHGGNCHVCGAHCIYTAIFHHVPSNTLIRTGMDCAEKLFDCDANLFRKFREDCKAAKFHKAGKLKAKQVLTDAGLEIAWEQSRLSDCPIDEPAWKCKQCDNQGCENCPSGNSWHVLCSIVGNLIRYGDISDKQVDLLRKLSDKIANWDTVKAERAAKLEAERAASKDCPTGKALITGEVLSTKFVDNQYGGSLKMLVRSDDGYKVWGSVPSSLSWNEIEQTDELGDDDDIESLKRIHEERVTERNGKHYLTWSTQRALAKGDRVTFRANVEPSNDDAKFGFYKRPTKASFLAE